MPPPHSPRPQRAGEDLLAILRKELHADHPIQVHCSNDTEARCGPLIVGLP